MGINYLWDTNTVIYFLQKQFPADAEAFVDSTLQDSPPAISAITEIELLCWKTNNQNDLDVLHQFIEEATIFELEKNIKRKTAEIRKTHRIKLPDAIIAATALIYDLTLITRNTKDFTTIDKLKIANPFEM
ncbi:MAG: type II toxin-antitoxin system VapC family toxin [Flavobacteriales bacterium]|nr:type II toxin-antitoxin system VapC family toxin [Flavobacteriales bacterium]